MKDKLFTEEEIARIIRRAAQMESEMTRSTETGGTGLTLDELITATSDTGIDPNHIRIAAREVQEETESDEQDQSVRQDGLVTSERRVDGRLSDELADLVIADLKHRYEASDAEINWLEEWDEEERDELYGKSVVRKTGRNVEWQHVDKHGSLETRVLIQPLGRQIRVRTTKRNLWKSRTDGPAGELYEYMAAIPFIAGMIVLFALPYSFLVSLLIALIVYLLLEFAARPVIKKIRQNWGNKLLYKQLPRIEDNREMYEDEVESLSEEIARIMSTNIDDSMIDYDSEANVNQIDNILRDPGERKGRGKTR